MPILTQSQLQSRTEGSQLIIKKWAGHSTVERKHYSLSDEEKISIGAAGQILPRKVVAEMTGVSVDCVGDLRNGRRGSDGFDRSLMDKINERCGQKKIEAKEVAVDRLLSSLGLLDSDKLAELGGKDLASAASNISKIISNLEPRETERGNSGSNVVIIMHQPKPLKESHFETIDI